VKERLIENALRAAGRRPPPSEEATHRAYLTAREEWQQVVRRQSRRRRWLGMTGLLAASVLAGALMIGFWPATPAPQTVAVVLRTQGVSNYRATGAAAVATRVQAAIPLGAVIETGPQARLALRLAAGHSLRLDHATRVVAVAPRVFRLEFGRIYVDSGDEAAGPSLRIDTPLAAISDIGTQFQVYATSQALRVQVRDGAVVLSGAGTNPAVAVATGEFVEMSADRRLTRGATDTFGTDWAWVATAAPELDAQERRLDRVLAWVCRELGFRLRYADARTRDMAVEVRLDGSLEGLSPQEALEVLQRVTNFSYRLNAGVLTLETLDGNR
jgi:ferric-dicitrate binding protein FerR (iron transport regulator)